VRRRGVSPQRAPRQRGQPGGGSSGISGSSGGSSDGPGGQLADSQPEEFEAGQLPEVGGEGPPGVEGGLELDEGGQVAKTWEGEYVWRVRAWACARCVRACGG
jgi:hypothetical protein